MGFEAHNLTTFSLDYPFSFFFFWWDWSLNLGLCTYKAGTLPLEPYLQTILVPPLLHF
jgi:hypothetical protein